MEQRMQKEDALKQQLLTLETRFWDAIQTRDARSVESLSSDPCIVAGVQGVSEIGREGLRKMMKSATYDLNGYKLNDVHIRKVSDDVAVLAYTVTDDLTVDGERLKLKAFDTSVELSNGEWTCVLHTESPKGDAFGRH